MYLSLIDWMLAQKAQEDAAFQRQIEEYATQGRVAVIVEDDSAKWAVFALSSNRKNQSFFNYYGPRKLRVSEAPIQDEPAPPAEMRTLPCERWLPERPAGWTVQNSTSTVTARSSAAM